MPLYIFFIIFLILSQAVLVGAHFLIFKFTAKVFLLISPKIKSTLLYALMILSVSFIPVSILMYNMDNFFSRFVYFLIGLWHGVVVNLLLAILASYILFWIFKIFNINLNFQAVGMVFIFLAIIFSTYGVYNATHVKVKKIKVEIKNLPRQWEGKIAVQISDLHLGNVLSKKYAETVVEKIGELNPDIIFITGDYFDGIGNDSDALASPLGNLNPAKGIYFINGNHEAYAGLDKSISAMESAGVKVLDNELVDIDGLLVVGLSYDDRSIRKNLQAEIEKLKDYDEQKPSILLYHSPSQIKKVEEAGIDLMLSGHTHGGQLLPFNLITNLIFKGYDYGLKSQGSLQVYATSGTGVWGPTMRTSGRNEIVVIELDSTNYKSP